MTQMWFIDAGTNVYKMYIDQDMVRVAYHRCMVIDNVHFSGLIMSPDTVIARFDDCKSMDDIQMTKILFGLALSYELNCVPCKLHVRVIADICYDYMNRCLAEVRTCSGFSKELAGIVDAFVHQKIDIQGSLAWLRDHINGYRCVGCQLQERLLSPAQLQKRPGLWRQFRDWLANKRGISRGLALNT